MEFTLRNLRYFVTAAQLGSFTAAAKQLRLSQPSISSAVDQLEDMLQVQLFRRLPSRGIELTPDGRTVLEEARRLLAHVDEFEASVGAVSSTLQGELTIGCFINLAPIYFTAILTGFRAAYPNIQINFREAHHAELLDGLNDGRFEIALTFDLEATLDTPAIELASRAPMAVLPIDHRLANCESASLIELSEEPLILMDLPHTNAYFLSLFHSVGLVPRVGVRTRSFEMVRCLAGAGIGYGLTNLAPAAETTYAGRPVSLVPLSDPVRPLKIILMHHRRLRLRRAAVAFIEYVTDYFSGSASASQNPR